MKDDYVTKSEFNEAINRLVTKDELFSLEERIENRMDERLDAFEIKIDNRFNVFEDKINSHFVQFEEEMVRYIGVVSEEFQSHLQGYMEVMMLHIEKISDHEVRIERLESAS